MGIDALSTVADHRGARERLATPPPARGALSAALAAVLARPEPPTELTLPAADGFDDEQIALWTLYELHHRGFDQVDAEWEWSPDLLRVRRGLEESLLARVRNDVGEIADLEADDLPAALDEVTSADGPSLSRHLHRRATRTQAVEFLVHKSVYHLKEADGHSWGIPRYPADVKAGLLEIQFDEYGGEFGAARMHSELFRATMRGFGLDDGYGRYVERVPATTLATGNLISLFGLHRRWRGALAGHLAAFEMTSSVPNRRYAQGFRRLGADDDTCRFFDEHVEADAVHEQLAVHAFCVPLVRREPELAVEVVFGAAAAMATDRWLAAPVLEAWEAGRTSLLPPSGGEQAWAATA